MLQSKSDLLNKKLTLQEFDQLKEARRNIFYFAQSIFVIHPVRGKVKFDLYPFQKAVLWSFLQYRFNIILKFRQAGVTELIAMFCLWFAMYHPNKNIVMISIKERVAKRLLRKIKYMYKNLPDHLKVPVINGRGDEIGTASELEFINESIITSVATTEEAGRSEAVSLLVIDEAAIVRWADQIWAAAFPTLSTGGGAILNSTPYGMGNFFHKAWVNAVKGRNNFNPIRLRWTMHPERDMAWYVEQSAVLGARRTGQEIDGNFLTSGNTVFDIASIRAMDDRIRNITWAIPPREFKQGWAYTYKLPEPGIRYSISSDVSTGRSRDYSSYSIMDKYGNERACFKGKLPPHQLAKLLMDKGKEYNYALLAPESNDIGLAVTSEIQNQGYPNLYYTEKILKSKGETRPTTEIIPGWYTGKKNRPLMISNLEEDIRDELVDIIDPFFVDEAYTFIYDDATNKPVALGKGRKKNSGDDILSDEGYTDDSIMAKAIVNQVRKMKVYTTMLPK